MVISTKITSIEIFAFIAVLIFNLLSRKVLITNTKDKRNCLKSRLFFKKIANFTSQTINRWDATFETPKPSFVNMLFQFARL